MAESTIGLYKTECTHREGPWHGVDDLELATLNWVDWFNTTRLHSALGYLPAIECETGYYRHINPQQQPLPGELALYCTPRGSEARPDDRSLKPVALPRQEIDIHQ